MIAVVSKSKRVSTADMHLATRACAHQLRYDASPAWGLLPIPVIYYSDEAHVPPGAWKIVVFDDADQAGDLGWHSEGPDGLPFGRVFAGPSLDNQVPVSSVLSHEVLEAFVDPRCNAWAEAPDGRLWALEVGDPCESDAYGVVIDGKTIAVSDFALPAFFDQAARAGTRCDFMGRVTTPFTLAHGGYAVVWSTGGQPQQIFDDAYPAWRAASKGSPASRTARRLAVPA